MVLYIAAPPPDFKTCTKCGQCEKHSKNNNRRDGLQSQCVQCVKAYRAANKDKINAQKMQHYEENKDEISAQQKAYYEENKDRILARKKKHYEEHRDEISARQKAYYEEKKDEILAYQKQHYEENKDKINARQKAYYEEKKDEIFAQHNEYNRNRRQTDDAFRVLGACRARLRHALKGNLKTAKTLELLGCTPDELLEHLERTMSPEVRARRDEGVEIVVDHIIPCATFDFSIAEHQRVCFNYTNLQYLDAPTNLSKRDTLPPGFNFASWFAARAASIKISPL